MHRMCALDKGLQSRVQSTVPTTEEARRNITLFSYRTFVNTSIPSYRYAVLSNFIARGLHTRAMGANSGQLFVIRTG